jgi:hypothetical protein
MVEFWINELENINKLLISVKSIIPLFHHSIIPSVSFGGPLLQPLEVCFAADPFPRLLIEEERDTATVAFVILSHQFGIRVMMPNFELLHF